MKYERLEMEVIDFNTFDDFMANGEEFISRLETDDESEKNNDKD